MMTLMEDNRKLSSDIHSGKMHLKDTDNREMRIKLSEGDIDSRYGEKIYRSGANDGFGKFSKPD